MTVGLLLLALFLFILSAVTAAGYVFVLRPSEADPRADFGDSAAPLPALNEAPLPAAQALLVDVFRLLGEAMPRRDREVLRVQLSAAG